MSERSMTVRPPAVLAVAALAGLGAAALQIFAWRSAKAKRLYLSQCDAALANPKFANPELLKLDMDARAVDGDREAFERYEWFVARLVYVLDECLRLRPSAEWYAVAETQLGNHKQYFSSDYYSEQNYLPQYSERMRELIEMQRGA